MNLGLGGGVRIGNSGNLRLGSSLKQPPATIAQTAYGAGSTPVKGGIEHWHAFIGIQAAAIAWLLFLRWSLPSGGKGRE